MGEAETDYGSESVRASGTGGGWRGLSDHRRSARNPPGSIDRLWSDRVGGLPRSWGEVDQALDTGMETDCPARFPGQFVEDALGLRYNFFRYYDPERGAFISQDPAGWEAGPNLYQYARNPINWTDPFGLTCPDYKGKDGRVT